LKEIEFHVNIVRVLLVPVTDPNIRVLILPA